MIILQADINCVDELEIGNKANVPNHLPSTYSPRHKSVRQIQHKSWYDRAPNQRECHRAPPPTRQISYADEAQQPSLCIL